MRRGGKGGGAGGGGGEGARGEGVAGGGEGGGDGGGGGAFSTEVTDSSVYYSAYGLVVDEEGEFLGGGVR